MSAIHAERVQLLGDSDSALIDAVCSVVSSQGLCPEDILEVLRIDRPGLTLERLLITLYENSALFSRTRGRWHLMGSGPRPRRWPGWSGEGFVGA